MKHLNLGPKQTPTSYRKIAIASWNHPRDPSTYTWIELPTEPMEAFLDGFAGGEARPTITHFVAKIIAHTLQKNPELDHVLRNGSLYRRPTTDLYITTLLKGKGTLDLSGFTLRDIPSKSLVRLAAESGVLVDALRKGEDAETERTKQVTLALPTWLLRPLIALQDWCHFTLNVSLKAFGIPDDRFGSAIVTNFGPLGLENGLVPLSPYCRCPMMIGIGKARKIPVVEGETIVARECVTISFTFDHRYADGAHGAQLMRLFQKIFTDPARYASVFE